MEGNTVLKKRKRRSISLYTKYKIIQEVEKGKKSKSAIAQEYGINSSTLTETVKQKDAIYKAVQTTDLSLNRKRLRWGKYEELEDDLYKWYSETSRCTGTVLSAQDITKKANEIAERLGITNFKSSVGFVYRFKARRGIVSQQTVPRSPKNNAGIDQIQWHDGISHEAFHGQQMMLNPPYGQLQNDEITVTNQQMQINSGAIDSTYTYNGTNKNNGVQHDADKEQSLLVIKSEPMEDASCAYPVGMIRSADCRYQDNATCNTYLQAKTVDQHGMDVGQNAADPGVQNTAFPGEFGQTSDCALGQSSVGRSQNFATAGHSILGAGRSIVGAGQNMIDACQSVRSSIQSIVNLGQRMVNEAQSIAGASIDIVGAGSSIVDAGYHIVGAIQNLVSTGQTIVGAGENIVGAGQTMLDEDQQVKCLDNQASGIRKSALNSGHAILHGGQDCDENTHASKRRRTAVCTFGLTSADLCEISNSDERHTASIDFNDNSTSNQLDSKNFNHKGALKSFYYVSNFIKSQSTEVPREALAALQTLETLLSDMDNVNQTKITDFFCSKHAA